MDEIADLRERALTARRAGAFEVAAAAWRAILDRKPNDWTVALELKRDMKSGLHYPDSDARFRRAARHLPDAAWLAHYSTLYAFHGSDLDVIEARAVALLEVMPAESRLHAIRGDVARQRRDWKTAAAAFEQAAALDPAHPNHGFRAAQSARYAHLQEHDWGDGGAEYPILVVNLDRNTERLVELERQFAGCAARRHRIAAVEGARLPAAAVQRLVGDPGAPRGTLGCFLSHAAAWEWLVANGAPAALVIEDDVIPLLELPGRLPAGWPAGWDVVFVNDRMEPREHPAGVTGTRVTPLPEAMLGFHDEDNAPGGDGYFVSRHGAEALLAWTARDGFGDDVDWRILAYGMTPAEVAALSVHGHARRELERLQARLPRAARLDAHVLYPALIRTVGVSSDREDENRKHG